MIGRAMVRLLASAIAAVLAPVGWWDSWQTRADDPWETDE